MGSSGESTVQNLLTSNNSISLFLLVLIHCSTPHLLYPPSLQENQTTTLIPGRIQSVTTSISPPEGNYKPICQSAMLLFPNPFSRPSTLKPVSLGLMLPRWCDNISRVQRTLGA